MQIRKTNRKIISGIKNYFKSAGKKKAVLGLSGGIDSALTASLAAEALGKRNVAVLAMPLLGTSSKASTKDAENLAKKLGIKLFKIPINKIKKQFSRLLWKQSKIAGANINARIRALLLYNYANSNDCLVVGTGNKTEFLLGYFTKFGDGAADIFPIGDLWKSEVRALSKFRKLPKELLEKPPSADLWKGQTDEGELGLSYGEMDTILEVLEKRKNYSLKNFDKTKVKKIKKRVAANRHKSLPTPIIKTH